MKATSENTSSLGQSLLDWYPLLPLLGICGTYFVSRVCSATKRVPNQMTIKTVSLDRDDFGYGSLFYRPISLWWSMLSVAYQFEIIGRGRTGSGGKRVRLQLTVDDKEETTGGNARELTEFSSFSPRRRLPAIDRLLYKQEVSQPKKELT
jgi:hypothetical protein